MTLKQRILAALRLGDLDHTTLSRMLGEPSPASLHDACIELKKSGAIVHENTWRFWVWKLV